MDSAETLNVWDVAGGAVIAVKVVPGASRDRISGVLGDCLKITTAAAAEKGKANAAVARMLARALGVDRRRVNLVGGRSRPRKEFRVAGISAGDVREAVRRLPT